MAIIISRQQKQLLLAWTEQAGEYECCGLLLGSDGKVERVELTRNVAAEPANSFEIDPIDLIAAQKQERQGEFAVLGYFHSHPNGLPSPSSRDAEMAAVDGRIWVIAGGGEVTAWRPIGGKDGIPVWFEPEAIVEG